MNWYQFSDMRSGGELKTPYEEIFIEAHSLIEAESIFIQRFRIDPDGVSCVCCGADFSTYVFETLEAASKYERNKGKIPLDLYISSDEVCVIRHGGTQ